MCSALITSPLTTIGTAGGQDTVGAAQILPVVFSTLIFSDGANIASRMLIALCGITQNSGAVLSALSADAISKHRSALSTLSISFSLLSGVNIITTQSQSENSISIPCALKNFARLVPENDAFDASMRIFAGSRADAEYPLSLRL